MAARLYSLALSHPGHAARGMLVYKGIEHRVVSLMPGFHPLFLRGLGFRGGTVPALRLEDGRRIQGSLRISRVLEELRPEPALFPADPDTREAVTRAERWGEEELQELVRRIFRWAAAGQQELREWMGRDLVGIPAPGLAGRVNQPLAARFARIADATDARVRADLVDLPGVLDEVDRLIANGVIGSEQPNAADFQIASSIRALLAFDDVRPMLAERSSAGLAERLFPRYPGPIPVRIPAAWIPAARTS